MLIFVTGNGTRLGSHMHHHDPELNAWLVKGNLVRIDRGLFEIQGVEVSINSGRFEGVYVHVRPEDD